MTGTALETVRTGSAISTELADLADSARDYAAASRAVNTTRAYGFAWSSFTTWCDQHGVEVMPATPGAVALYLTSRADSGAKVRYLDPDGIRIGTSDRRVNHFGAGFGVAKLQTCQIVQKRGDGLVMNW